MKYFSLILIAGICHAQPDLRRAAESAGSLQDTVNSANEVDCLPDGRPINFTPGNGAPCSSASPADGYQITKVNDCSRGAQEYPGGFTFRAKPGHPHLVERSPYPDGGNPGRMIDFVSRNGAINDTFLHLEENAGGPDSHDVKSMIFLLPRNVTPSVKVVGNDVEVTMTTGEKVVFDKRTSAIKSGALREGPADLNTDRFRRQPPNVHYSGSGISIRLNHRFEYPTMGAEFAEVKQGTKSCRVPRANLFDASGRLKSSNDASFLAAINSSCPRQNFSL